jgi:cytochrome o ubiquinol oxidase subunit II
MARAKKYQKIRNRIIAASTLVLAALVLLSIHLGRSSVPVLDAAGPIAAGQRDLLIWAFLLMLLIVVPVFVLAFGIARRYRETNKKATYNPNWDSSWILEAVWWLIPTALIVVLAVMTWHGTYKYDPHRPLESSKDALVVQVVALDWRWLFIYPEQQVASINELRIPANTPIQFEITADAPMNSFWIPQLGGQVYAMPGMGTRLYLMADREGSFRGSGANISGEGFSNMNFQTIATDEQEFDVWVAGARSQAPLTKVAYDQLAKQTTDEKIYTFSKPADGLYGTIISKYMNTEHAGGAH